MVSQATLDRLKTLEPSASPQAAFGVPDDQYMTPAVPPQPYVHPDANNPSSNLSPDFVPFSKASGMQKAIDYLGDKNREVDIGFQKLDLGILPKWGVQAGAAFMDSTEAAAQSVSRMISGEPIADSRLAEGANLGVGVVDAAGAAMFPGGTVALTALQDTFPDQYNRVMEKAMTGIRVFNENVPGFKHIREQIPEDQRQVFDNLMLELAMEVPLLKGAQVATKKMLQPAKVPTLEANFMERAGAVDTSPQIPQTTKKFDLPEAKPMPDIPRVEVPDLTPKSKFENLKNDTIEFDFGTADFESVKLPETDPKVVGRAATVDALPFEFKSTDPTHIYFKQISEGLQRADSKSVNNGDVVVLKDGTIGEFFVDSKGKPKVNKPTFYTKAHSEWDTVKIKDSDIAQVYVDKEVDSRKFENEVDMQDDASYDEFLTKFVKEASKKSKTAPAFDINVYKKNKKEKFASMSDADLHTYIKENAELLESKFFRASMSPKSMIANLGQRKFDVADSYSRYDLYVAQMEQKRRVDMDRYKKGLEDKDLVWLVKEGTLTKREALKISRDNKASTMKTIFSADSIMSIETQLRKVSKPLAQNLRRATANKIIRFGNAIEPFSDLKSKWKEVPNKKTLLERIPFSKRKKSKLSAVDMRKSQIYTNANMGVELLTKPQRKVLDDIYVLTHNYGLGMNYRKGYIPQMIADPKGLLEYFNSKAGDLSPEIDAMIKDAEANLGRKMDEGELAAFINEILQENTTSKLNDKSAYFSNAERRKITEITREMGQFYHNPYDSIQMYLDKAFTTLEMMDTFGYRSQKNFDSVADVQNSDTSKVTGGGITITSWLDMEMAKGNIDIETGKRLESLLLSRFKDPVARNKFEQTLPYYKEIIKMMNIANPISAITNLKDLGLSFYSNGILRSFGAFGKSVLPNILRKKIDSYVSMEDLGLYVLDVDLQSNVNLGKYKNSAIKMSGFAYLDRVGKEVYVNAAYGKLKKRAEKGESWYSKTIEGRDFEASLKKDYGMSESQISQLKSDLKNGKLSDDVKYVLITQISEVQPVTKSAMPPNYSKTLTGRMFYTFKTFLVKRFDYYRSEFFDVEHKNVKSYAQRAARMIRFAMLMSTAGMAWDEVKDWLLGRNTTVSEQLTNNLIELAGLSKYTIYQFRESTSYGEWQRYVRLKEKTESAGRIFEDKFESTKGVLENIWGIAKGSWSIFGVPATPFTTIGDEIFSYRKSKEKEVRYEFSQGYSVSRIPIGGKIYYWLRGEGAERQATANQMRKKTSGFENRTLRELINPNINADGDHMYFVKVARVVDGDTLDFQVSKLDAFRMTSRSDLIQGKLAPQIKHDDELGNYVSVRFQGSDTPESVHKSLPVQFMGKEASEFSKESLLGKQIMIKSDALGDGYDKYHRLLGSVHTREDAAAFLYNIPGIRNAQSYEDFTLKLVESGLAKVAGSFGFSDKDLYYDVQNIARSQGIGVRDKEAEDAYNILHDISPEEQQTEYEYEKNPEEGGYVRKKTSNYSFK